MRRVHAARLQGATDLLALPDERHRAVTDIALACGVNDVSRFGRLFTPARHVTPSEWRRVQ